MHERSSLPPSLDDQLREEPDEVRHEIHALWASLGESAVSADSPDTDAAWAGVLAAIRPESTGTQTESAPTETRTAPDRPAARRRRTFISRFSFAATLMLVAAASLTVLAWNRAIVVTANPGQIRFVELPDGSSVAVNSGSTLRYRRNFQRMPFVDASRRSIWLRGEAYFRVQPSETPFVVFVPGTEITVLGTAFNVRARGTIEDAETRVSVSSGLVQVAVPDGEAVELTAGQTSTVRPGAVAPTPAQATDDTRIASWRNGGFSVRGLSLQAVLDEIERRFNVSISWEGAPPPSDTITLYMADADGPDDVLRDLSSARGLEFRASSQGYTIRSTR